MCINKNFFKQSTLDIAAQLIGFRLCRYLHNTLLMDTITETEAYLDEEDLASHARFGQTERNAPMYGSPGIWYIYMCYGIHAMLNLVTSRVCQPSAVLIRSVKNVSGPGRLTKYFHITRVFNNRPCNPKSGLWLLPPVEHFEIEKTPRIGVAYAGDIWSKKPYRFVAKLPIENIF